MSPTIMHITKLVIGKIHHYMLEIPRELISNAGTRAVRTRQHVLHLEYLNSNLTMHRM